MNQSVVIIGAGPAGLTAGYLLSKNKIPVTVLEADPKYVGGISRTVEYRGYLFDIGGHRFFSKSAEVENLWNELLPDDMIERPRSSRIYYRGNFFSYPLKAFDALFKLGVFEAALCVLSYLKAKAMPVKNPKNFEDWVSNHFGKRLFNIFFKTYTEKVWGMSCKEISADWAAQRIKGLSLSSAIWHAIVPQRKPKNSKAVIKTLIDTFKYPRRGPGMMWETAAEKIKKAGGKVEMGQKVIGLEFVASQKNWKVTSVTASGEQTVHYANHVISSAPIRELMANILPKPPVRVLNAAQSLKYRDFITVAIIMKERNIFDDNWIYIHEPNVKVGRVQNFKSWSPELIPDANTSCYGLEYFCFEGDGLWNSSDADLIELAKTELKKLSLGQPEDFLDGCVVRQPKAYPVYDDTYEHQVNVVRANIDAHYPGLHLVGRNGMHKYNNQDHAMMTAMLTVENIMRGQNVFDTWQVNQDAEYHEKGTAGHQAGLSTSGLREVPKRVSSEAQL